MFTGVQCGEVEYFCRRVYPACLMYSLTEAVTQIPIKKGGFVGASMVFDLGKGGGGALLTGVNRWNIYRGHNNRSVFRRGVARSLKTINIVQSFLAIV